MQRKPLPPNEADLEITAELPVLDVAAFEASRQEEQLSSTDTWIVPAGGWPAPAQTPTAPDDGERTKVEMDLRALSETLREVEERLTRKGQRLAEIEGELVAAQAERAAVEGRAAAVSTELTAARAGLAAAEEQIIELKRAGERHQELAAELAARDRLVASAQLEIRELETRVGGYLEVVHSLQGQRGVFEGLLLGLDAQTQERDARIVRLEREFAHQAGRARELTADCTARDARIASLQREVNTLAEALAQRNEQVAQAERSQGKLHETIAALEGLVATADARNAEQDRQSHAALAAAQAANAETQLRLTAAEIRVRELENAAADEAETARARQEELRVALARVAEIEGDLRAAEDAVHRVEAELRSKTTKLEELAKTAEERRSIVEQARQSLAQRDAFIQRLEAEAAQSAVLLGSIQQSIRKMDPGGTGNHELVPEGAVRLLIRADGDSEVVHVLSRKTTIGRTPENDLQIEAKFISRHHAVILAGPTYTVIEDLNSTNGVLVNGRRVTRHTLKDGDTVTIGKTHFRFAVRPAR